MAQKVFSQQVEAWLTSDSPKTFGHLVDAFGKSSFATIFILCMALPALPIPTGGVTHVLEVITMLVAVQTIIGLKNLWLPEFIRRRPVPKTILEKALPLFVRHLKRLEKYSRVRGAKFLNNQWTERLAGIFVLIFAIGAAFAIPFSGLDTIVSMGVVLLSLGLVTEDVSFFIIGIVAGVIGVFVEVLFGEVVARAVRHFFAHASGGLKWAVAGALVLLVAGLVIHHYKKR